MKILFTSDTHGNELAIGKFAEVLRDDFSYDCGIIAGDILDDHLPIYARRELLGFVEDSIPELHGVDENTAKEVLIPPVINLETYESLVRALYVYEERTRSILANVKKPIFLLCGNHDLTTWETRDNIYNIHSKRINFQEFNFVGYQYTEFDRSDEKQLADFQILRKYIDKNTILVTHSPTYGILDYDGVQHIGSKPLCELIKETQPRLHLHGHIHQASGHKGRTINGSWQDERVFWSIAVEAGRVTRIVAFPSQEPMTEWARRLA